jgi:hypothetical protein
MNAEDIDFLRREAAAGLVYLCGGKSGNGGKHQDKGMSAAHGATPLRMSFD